MMQKLHGIHFIHLSTRLSTLSDVASRLGNGPDSLSADGKGLIENELADFRGWLELSGLITSKTLVKNLEMELASVAITSDLLVEKLRCIDSAFQAELGSHVFLYLDQNKADYLFKQSPFGEEVADSFPQITFDINEASNCLALGRATAVVFHLMRSLEPIIKALIVNLDISNVERNWGAYLKAIREGFWNKYSTNSDSDKEWKAFYSEVEPYLRAIKDGWRNDVTHNVETIYTMEEAEGIYRNVKALTQKVATKLNGQT